MHLSQTFQTNTTERHLARFLTVGLLGTAFDIALFAVLYGVFGLSVLTANVIAYSAGIVHNFLLHRYWTYRDITRKPAAIQAAQFATVSLSAMALNTTLVLVLGPPLAALIAAPKWGDLLAKLCATGIGVSVNFFANHFWTFAATRTQGEQS